MFIVSTALLVGVTAVWLPYVRYLSMEQRLEKMEQTIESFKRNVIMMLIQETMYTVRNLKYILPRRRGMPR